MITQKVLKMNKMATHLEKLASEVETTGLTDTKSDAHIKIASAGAAINALTMYDLPKILAGAAALSLGTSIVGKGIDAVGGAIDNLKYEHRKNNVILPYAKKHNPSLRAVADDKLGGWLDSAKALAPEVAKDKMLASTYLNNVHALGGQVDLHTASTLSTIGKNTSSHGSMADMIGGNMSSASNLLVGA
jgi:hypothetical protein